MDKQQEQLENLREIRSIMERSSRFLSLSGFTGVVAGVSALIGVGVAYFHFNLNILDKTFYHLAYDTNGKLSPAFYSFLLIDLLIVFIVSLLVSRFLTVKKAKQHGNAVWDATAKRLFINMAIPLITGGAFCFSLLYHGAIEFIAPASLVFYGLALINASKYTLNDIRYLGFAEIITGLCASLILHYGILFWAFGFGVLHIVYGVTMYYKYEK